jgi:hypothetical protein
MYKKTENIRESIAIETESQQKNIRESIAIETESQQRESDSLGKFSERKKVI